MIQFLLQKQEEPGQRNARAFQQIAEVIIQTLHHFIYICISVGSQHQRTVLHRTFKIAFLRVDAGLCQHTQRQDILKTLFFPMAAIARVIFGAVGQSAAFCQSEQKLCVDRRQQLESFQRLRDGQLFRQQQNTAAVSMEDQVADVCKAGELQRGAGNGRLLLEIAERYVILAVLTMTAPLAFAMGGSKSTSEIFGGWCRMFGSMCTLMVTNVIFFKMLLSVLSNVPSGLDIIPWIVLVLTIVKVARKADAIITRIGLNPAITGDSLGRGFPGTLTYMVMRSATSHITKTIGKSTGKGNRGAASGSTTGGPRIGGGPSGAHNAAGHTASYQAYQATQQQNTSQGADGQGFVSQRESVQSGGAQTATQEHFSNSSMQNTSSIRQTAFRGAEARKSSVPSGMRRAPAYVTSVDRVSPSSAQTPAAGYDTSGNKTTSTVREQSNVTASIRTANSAQHSLSGNASQHEMAGRSPAPMSTRMTQANMQGVRSKVNDRSAQRPEQTENAAAQSIDHAVPAAAQRPSPGGAGISSSPAVSGQHSSQPFGMGTRYTQRPSCRGVGEQKPEAIRSGHAGTSPTQHAPSSVVESARSSSGRAAHPSSSTQGYIAGSRPDRNIPQGSNVPPNQTRKSNNSPAQQETRPIGIRNEPSAKGMFSAQRPDPAGNRADVSQGTLTRPTTGNRAAASKSVSMPSTLIKGSVKNSKEISSSRKQRREKHERK